MSRLIVVFVAALWGAATARAEDPLWDRFQSPAAEARPMVRWWWNGNAVDASQIERELETLHQAGFGGVEICPTALPTGAQLQQTQRQQAKPLKWLSPEWCRMLKVAADAATQRQMRVDLVAGCGLPWGGEFVAPEHAAQRVELITRRITGPMELKLTREELLAPPPTAQGRAPAQKQAPELLFLRLVPVECGKIEEMVDLHGSLDAQGNLVSKIPKGEFTLCTGLLRKGFLSVQRNPDGAGLPVVDHLNRDAVRSYLDHISSRVRTNLGDTLGKFVQTMVCDDGTLAGANWTGDFAKEFNRRCGYELGPYLPLVVDFEQKVPVSKEFAATVARVRHDYARTIAELYHDRFVETFHAWCGEQGTQSRLQAVSGHGLTGLAELQLVPDVPQAGSPLLANSAAQGYPIGAKYASSAGHLAGRRVIGIAAMLNTRGVFQESLAQIKAADDRNFLLGANRTIAHSFNYSPREAGFPGWVRSGSYCSPYAAWWPYLPLWTDYNARLSAVFQASEPVVQVAILAPSADEWGEGPAAKAIRRQPWYVDRLWRSLSQQGVSADYVTERVLRRVKCEKGKLCYGPMNYDAVVVIDTESLAPATTSALVTYADGGGKLAFVGRKPNRSVGLHNAEQRDPAVRQAMQHLVDEKNSNVVSIAAPEKPAQLLGWTGELLKKLGAPHSVAFDKPTADVQQVHYRHEGRDLFLLVNTSPQRAVTTTARFAARGEHAWRWDAETGRRAVYPTTGRQARIHLAPHESVLMVFESTEPPAVAPRVEPPVEAWQALLTLSGPWSAEFAPAVGRRFTLIEVPLDDLSKSEDERLQHFAGTVTYRTRFELPEIPAGTAMIDVGNVHDLAEVQLNGEPLGLSWYGQPRMDATRRLSAGDNTLEIRVATPLFNYTRSLDDNPTAKYWTERAANKEPMPSGLVGPVRIVVPVANDDKEKAETANGKLSAISYQPSARKE